MIGTIHGRLTRDPEVRKFVTQACEDGQVCNFTVAADNRFGAKTEASFYPCSVFGKRASTIEKYFRKGSEIVVVGHLEQDEYESNGEKKRTWKMHVIDFDFCGSGKGKAEQDQPAPGFSSTDEDIPF